jgi:hypothetical protein
MLASLFRSSASSPVCSSAREAQSIQHSPLGREPHKRHGRASRYNGSHRQLPDPSIVRELHQRRLARPGSR